jgi:hypothetical protein
MTSLAHIYSKKRKNSSLGDSDFTISPFGEKTLDNFEEFTKRSAEMSGLK